MIEVRRKEIMKTVLFVSPTGTLDNGAEISIFNLMRYLVEQGYTVINIAPTQKNSSENSYSKKFASNGINCILIKSQRWWWEEAPGNLFGTEIERAVSYRETIKKIAEVIDQNNVDIVISNTVNVFQGAVGASIKSVPHFWLIHEFPENEFSYYIEKLDFIDDYATELFAVNGKLAEKVQQLFPNRQINGFSPYTEVDRVDLKVGQKQRIVSIGRITERKNQLEIIQAYKQLNRLDIELVFIGGWDEDYKKKCMKYIKENQLTAISFLGNKDNPWEYVADKDLCVFSSKMETFGLVYVEAILNGLPTILSDNPGHKSSYEMFEYGQLYASGNVEELTTLIATALDNFEDLRKEAYLFSKEAQTIYQCSVAYQEIIEALLNNNYQSKNSIAQIENLLMLDEKKSGLSKFLLRIRRKIQRISYKFLGR